MLAPTIDQLSVEMAGRVKVAKLNIDENPQTANRFGVRSIPTLLVLAVRCRSAGWGTER
jgi:thioredoxin 1